jgi:tRNA-specific 2-thiouridylase
MKICLALSGGVDSSVSAFLLKKQGYQVISVFMKNYFYNTCSKLEEDKIEAMLVSQQLNIPFISIDISYHYERYVIKDMIHAYSIGKTPNPDIICNKKIKFNLLLKFASQLGAIKIATGHYARIQKLIINQYKFIYQLLPGIDVEKDQSYFLCQLNQYQLSKIVFPLGFYKKKEVRMIANNLKLITAKKKDSYGLCMMNNFNLSKFLSIKINNNKGNVIKISKLHKIYKKNIDIYTSLKEKLFFLSEKIKYNITDGYKIGEHDGIFHYTKGQRKGIKIGGFKKPLFVIEISAKNNILFVGESKTHPGLYKKAISINKDNFHWINNSFNKNYSILNINYMIRYRQNTQKGILYIFKNKIYIKFIQPEFAVTEGQFIAIYIKNELIGSSIIE